MSGYEQWVALVTLMRKEIKRYTRIWTQTLLPSAITMSLYFLIFGSLIGDRIGQMGGVSYMEFVVPGLIMMSIVTNSYANVVSSFFGSKFNNSIEELLVSPTPNHIILLGFISGGVSRGMLVALIVTAGVVAVCRPRHSALWCGGVGRGTDVGLVLTVWADQCRFCQYLRRYLHRADLCVDAADLSRGRLLFVGLAARFLGFGVTGQSAGLCG